MKRLTTDHPEGNFETVLNFVYGKDGVAHLRSDGKRDDVPVHEWAKKQCIARGCDEFPGETLEEIDETICECGFDFPDCPVHLAYIFACQAVHLRDRLKMYEGTDLMPDEITTDKPACVFYCSRRCNLDGDWCAEGPGCSRELDSESAMKLLEKKPPNTPLTLKELQEMDGEPVWVVSQDERNESCWMLVDAEYKLCREAHGGMAVFENNGKTWLAYRHKPEEGSHAPSDPAVPNWAEHLQSRFLRAE